VPVPTKAGVVDKDGTPRPGTTAEALAGLKPAFRPMARLRRALPAR
jgi:acetyl-CoA acyltransferase